MTRKWWKFWSPKNKPESSGDGFAVEYYPLTGRFYPTYRGRYLQRCYLTGIIETKERFLFAYADFGRNEDEAWRIIALFKEQRLKENVRVLRSPPPVDDISGLPDADGERHG